ncbi:7845_t:CDS:2, partial [Racocetra persica]
QHLKIKMATGSEALRVLLQGIDLEKELIQAQEQKKPESIRFLQATKLKEENTIATTQINNFYRKIILINERVKHYQELNKTYRVLLEEIVHNEKRRLQKAVDELHVFCLQNLSGKEGILRNSLGKRVDYSGRSVITPNPHLLLNQAAEQLIRDNDPVIFPLLNEVMQDHPVLINRAPTLHRISVQGAYPRP